MKSKETLQDTRLNNFIQAARDAEVKLTHQRLEVFRELAATDEHPDIETIFKKVRERIPTISLDTIYRTFAFLEEAGVLEKVSVRGNRARFDLNIEPHHHFICKNCGIILDFQCKEVDSFPIPAEVQRWGKVNQAYLELRGTCKECSEVTPL